MTSSNHATSHPSVADQVELDAQLRWLTYLHTLDVPAAEPQQWQQALAPLLYRAERARAVLEEREREHRQVIDAALSVLSDYRQAMPELDEDELVEHAAATASPALDAPWPLAGDEDGAAEFAVLAEPVTDAHIDAAPTETSRRLLIETAAAQHAITKLRGTHADTARDATGMWREYHSVHGYEEEAAESAAWLETYEGVQAVYDNAYYDLDYQADQRVEQRRATRDEQSPTADQRVHNRAVDPRTGVYQDELDALVAGAPHRAAHAANTPDDADRLRARLTADHPHERREHEQASDRTADADATQQNRLDAYDDDLVAGWAADAMARKRAYAVYGHHAEAPDEEDELVLAERQRRHQSKSLPADHAQHGDQQPARQHRADQPHGHVHNAVLDSQAVRSAPRKHRETRTDAPSARTERGSEDEHDRGDRGDAVIDSARTAVNALAARRRELDARHTADAGRAEQLSRWHHDDHHRGTAASASDQAPGRGARASTGWEATR